MSNAERSEHTDEQLMLRKKRIERRALLGLGGALVSQAALIRSELPQNTGILTIFGVGFLLWGVLEHKDSFSRRELLKSAGSLLVGGAVPQAAHILRGSHD